jgi:hypothetical protein
MKTFPSFGALARVFAFGVLLSLGAHAQAQTDPLPSWNDGPAKQAIVAFVKETTDQASPNFVPAGELIVDDDRYVLGLYRQENLKFVRSGQPVEIALDLYPGRIVSGTVDSIWWGTGQGQFLPTSELPSFAPQESRMAEGLFAVKIRLDAVDQKAFPIGAQGTAAIYTEGGGFAALRRVSIRAYSWGNWLYPL